jgi:hypothetical protein
MEEMQIVHCRPRRQDIDQVWEGAGEKERGNHWAWIGWQPLAKQDRDRFGMRKWI